MLVDQIDYPSIQMKPVESGQSELDKARVGRCFEQELHTQFLLNNLIFILVKHINLKSRYLPTYIVEATLTINVYL